MKRNVPIYNPISWKSTIPNLIMLGLYTLMYWIVGVQKAYMFGVGTWIMISMLIRPYFFERKLKSGLRLVQQEKFNEAIPLFKDFLDYFKRYRFLDRWRFYILLSANKFTYEEIGLMNIALCYSQIGELEKASEIYQSALKINPDNEVAKTYLRSRLNDARETIETKG